MLKVEEEEDRNYKYIGPCGGGGAEEGGWSLSCAGDVLIRLDLSNLKHHRPLVW